MKQWHVTPVSANGTVIKNTFVAMAVMMALAGPLSIFTLSDSTAYADQFDSQVSALNSQIIQYQAQANALASKSRTLQSELEKIGAEKNAIQTQIQLSQTRYDQLQTQILDTEKKILSNKDALGDTLATMYVVGSVSPFEMLASSTSIADYVDQQEYRSSISDTLKSTILSIKRLKSSLEVDREQVKAVLDRQEAQRQQLVAKEIEQAKVVAQTKGEEAAFQQLVQKTQTQLQEVSNQQKAYYESLRSRGGVASGSVGSFVYQNYSGEQDCGGGYPYCAAADTQVDPWGLYNRECVSYVAWALENRFDRYVGHFSGNGNADDWRWSAAKYSGAEQVTDPQPGDAVIVPADPVFAPVGHAMIVESVDNGWVRVSQYNMYGLHQYSTMDIRATGVVFLRFPPQ